MSPIGSFRIKDFSILRMIFPLRVFGSSLVNIILSGLAVGPIVASTCFISSFLSSSEGLTVGLRITKATGTSPFISCGHATTAH